MSAHGSATAEVHAVLLTERERRVAALVACGFTDRRIAERLHISPHTVGRHLKNTFEKLRIHNRDSLALYAVREGIVGLHCRPELAEQLTQLAGLQYEKERHPARTGSR